MKEATVPSNILSLFTITAMKKYLSCELYALPQCEVDEYPSEDENAKHRSAKAPRRLNAL